MRILLTLLGSDNLQRTVVVDTPVIDIDVLRVHPDISDHQILNIRTVDFSINLYKDDKCDTNSKSK